MIYILGYCAACSLFLLWNARKEILSKKFWMGASISDLFFWTMVILMGFIIVPIFAITDLVKARFWSTPIYDLITRRNRK